MCWWSGWGISTIRRTRCLWAAMWRLPLFTDIAQALASDAGPLDDLVPVQQEGLNITRETVCTATGDLDVSCAGTPPKGVVHPRTLPYAFLGRVPHHPY